jgi:hypothetical protein
MKRHLLTAAAVASLLFITHAATATLITQVDPSKANGTFIPGSGIPGQFAVNSANGAQVAIAAHDRNSVTAVPNNGVDTFIVPAGNDPFNAARTAWNLDFQFTPAAGKVQSDYTYQLQADIDPGLATTNFVTLNPIDFGDSVVTNPGGGAWSNNTTPFVIANSENYKFATFAGSGFTNPELGRYEIRATLFNASDNSVADTATAFVQVVPEPASLGVLGGIVALGMLRRRNRR